MVNGCKISGCVSGLPKDRKIRKSLNIKQASMFEVPKNAALRSQWSSVLKIDLPDKNFICDHHFHADSIIKEVRHEFPDGSFQIVPRERWTLISGAIPINSEPRRYGDELSENRAYADPEQFVSHSGEEVHQPLQQIDNHPLVLKRSLPSPCRKNSAQLLSTNCENDGKHVNIDVQPPPKKIITINDSSKQSVSSQVGQRHSFDKGANVGTKLAEHIAQSPYMPPGWFYFTSLDQMTIVHVDTSSLTEKIRVIVNADNSATVSFNQQEKMNLKINFETDIRTLLGDLAKSSICTGTGMKDMRASAKCCGFIMDNEKYKRQQRYPRCAACRVLRHRLRTKALKQQYAAIKKNKRQPALGSRQRKRKHSLEADTAVYEVA